MNAADWGDALVKQAEEMTQQAILDEQMTIGLDLFGRVVLKSPTDTGRFRGNWFVALGAANLTTTEETSRNAQSEGNAVIMGMTAPTMLILSNNLVYGEPLESGSSTQAPAGMVGVSVAEIVAKYGSVSEIA